MSKSKPTAYYAPWQPIARGTIVLVLALLALLWLNASLYAAGNIEVTSTADSGPGTLRQAMLDAQNGDTITFDPAVFPPASPATIMLTSTALSVITQGNLTIDGSAAGVIVDGSGFGGPPRTLLLDDVSLTLDGGANQIVNGDFSSGMGHWRPSKYGGPGATRSLETVDVHSSPASYKWTVIARSQDTATVYDTENISTPVGWPYDADSTAWITATGGSELVLRFWHKGEAGEIEFWALDAGDDSDEFDEGYFGDSSIWKQTAVTVTLPSEAVAVAFQFEFEHPDWRDYHGLRITSDNNTIKGLQIVGFPTMGIQVTDGASRNTIADNVIGDNSGGGLLIAGSDTLSNTVVGNYIGTNAAGTTAAPNGGDGGFIIEEAKYSVIGGPSAAERNVISGNARQGLFLAETSNNTVIGNYIGTDASGTAALPNKGHGIEINSEANKNVIGPDNVVAHNGNRGIFVVRDAIENSITQSAIYSNTSKGIELREGGNLEISAPVLTKVGASSVTGQAPGNSSVEIFSDAADEGRYYHGVTTADAVGHFTFTQTAGFTGTNVTATATDGNGNTSEFSLATAHNVAPIVTASGNQTATEGVAQLFALGSFTDPDADGPWQGSVSWGDGSMDTTFSVTSTGSLPDQSHIYTPTSTYTATVTVDDGIDSGYATFQVSVISVGSVEVVAYEDVNRNGKQDEGEPALPGVTVTLSDETNAAATDAPTLTRTEITDEDGKCRFEDVPVGDYVLSFASPEGYALPDPAPVTVKAGETTTPDPVMVEREDSFIYLPAVGR